MNNISALHAAIQAVCPISGISVGDPADKATWRLDFSPEATDAQRTVAQGIVAAFDLAAPTAAAIKTEAQRRIMNRLGASDAQSCIFKELNALMRAQELTEKKASGEALAPDEEAEAAALKDLAADIKAIRSASNIIEASTPVPPNYTDDAFWP